MAFVSIFVLYMLLAAGMMAFSRQIPLFSDRDPPKPNVSSDAKAEVVEEEGHDLEEEVVAVALSSALATPSGRFDIEYSKAEGRHRLLSESQRPSSQSVSARTFRSVSFRSSLREPESSQSLSARRSLGNIGELHPTGPRGAAPSEAANAKLVQEE